VIEIAVSGAFRTEHIFHTAGGVLGKLTMNASRSQGIFQGQENLELVFVKESFWKSTYNISRQGQILGTAKPEKVLSRKVGLAVEGETYNLHPGGSKLRSWRVLNSDGQPLIEIQPKGGLRRGARLLFFRESTVSVIVFAYCLVTRRWQEESSAG
jgi:hypothetical protein